MLNMSMFNNACRHYMGGSGGGNRKYNIKCTHDIDLINIYIYIYIYIKKLKHT